MNGVTVPAPTTEGRTFRYGVLSLAKDNTGWVEYCTALPVRAGRHVLHWHPVDGSHVEFTYLDSAAPIDTAVVSGQTMNWRVKVAEPDIGPSFWRLVLTSLEPEADRYDCS